jgi:hypothetical protein
MTPVANLLTDAGSALTLADVGSDDTLARRDKARVALKSAEHDAGGDADTATKARLRALQVRDLRADLLHALVPGGSWP